VAVKNIALLLFAHLSLDRATNSCDYVSKGLSYSATAKRRSIMAELTPSGRFGRYLFTAMEDNEMEGRELAEKIDMTYEHVRKLIKNLALPSDDAILRLSNALDGFDTKEAKELANQDAAQRTFKKDFNQLAGVPEDADQLLKSWPYLSQQSKLTLMTMANAFEKTDRGSKRK
jgi:transcriptional regulator with XRE-family HTH domain